MVDMYDSVNPNGIPDTAQFVAAYMDGAKSKWPQAALDKWGRRAIFHVTTMGDPTWPDIDCERFDATPQGAAAAAKVRHGRGQCSRIYCNGASCPAVVTALGALGLDFLPAERWPTPGVYLWAAQPTGVSHLDVGWAPVAPVAVQDRWTGPYDVSTLHPALAANPWGLTAQGETMAGATTTPDGHVHTGPLLDAQGGAHLLEYDPATGTAKWHDLTALVEQENQGVKLPAFVPGG